MNADAENAGVPLAEPCSAARIDNCRPMSVAAKAHYIESRLTAREEQHGSL
jgi:hypothetical protein